jgi:hypothetical protein
MQSMAPPDEDAQPNKNHPLAIANLIREARERREAAEG